MSAGQLAVAGAATAVLAPVLVLAVIRRRLTLVTVRGRSMAPAFRDGDRLVIVRRASYQVGDVIMFRAPGHLCLGVEWLVKRTAAVAGDPVPADLARQPGRSVVPAGQLLVRSDAADGLGSRQLGFIDARDVAGVVHAPGPGRARVSRRVPRRTSSSRAGRSADSRLP